MKSFKEFYEEKEEVELNEVTDAFFAVLAITGYLGIMAYGGRLIINGTKKVVPTKFKNKWNEIKKFFVKNSEKDFDVEKAIDKIEANPIVKKQKTEEDKLRRKYEENLSDVFEAIQEKNEQAATIALKESGVKATPEVNRVIVSEIVRALEEPPIHFGNTGNDAYLFIKKILGIKVARAAASVVQEALRRQGEQLVKDM